MSDNEDLLGDDLGDQSLADYNLGNEEEEQLLADDYESNSSQNVPTSIGPSYGSADMVSTDYSSHSMEYSAPQSTQYQQIADTECVVPNITVEVPNAPLPEHSTYAPYEPPVYEPEHAVVPPAIPAAPLESPQIVPTDMPNSVSNGATNAPRERFTSERAPGSQRLPQVRDIPDSLDKVFIPRGGYGGGRGRTSWRNPHFQPRYNHPYRRNNMHRGNFNQRQSFPPQQLRPSPPQMRPEIRPELHLEVRPEFRPDIRPEFRPDNRPQLRPEIHPDMRPDLRPDGRPEMREMRPEIRDMRPEMRDMRPEIREMRPEMRDVRPEMRDMRPEMREMRPEMRDMRPEIREMRPEMRDMRPEMREMRPEMRDMRPEMREMRPEMRDMRPEMRDMRPEMRDMRPEMRDMRPDIRQDVHPDMRMEPMQRMPPMGPEISPERPILPEMQFRPENRFGPNAPRPNFRPNMEERPFGPRPMYFPRPGFNPRPFGPPIREIAPNNVNHMPQVTIRQPLPMQKMEKFGPGGKPREQEVIMLPVQLPPNLPPGGLAGKKVLINPHFKGNFQPPGEGLPTYIPTRIQKSPPLSPTLETKFGPVKDIDDAAERFIAEQRDALARAANRKPAPRRSPQRYIENTTIEIKNDMMESVLPPASDLELLRRQEAFIHANRQGLRRRMRSPSPARRSTSPRRSPDRRHRPDRTDRPERTDRPDRSDRPDRTDRTERPHDEDSEYRRRVREQESLRERVLRAKEVRRRKNAVALQKQLDERERDRQDKPKDQPRPDEPKDKLPDKPSSTEDTKPDTTRKSPEKPVRVEKEKERVKEEREKIRERSPVKEETAEVNSTCEGLTPPRSPPRALTPPLPRPADSDDDLDLILGDIDGILSDDDEPKKPARSEPAPPADLRGRLPARTTTTSAPSASQRQKIVFHDKKEKTPPRRAVVTSSTKTDSSDNAERKSSKAKSKTDASSKSRPRITFDNKEQQPEKEDDKKSFANRRVILQRKVTPKEKSVFSRIEIKSDPTKPNPGIFSRAVRTAIGTEKTRIVVKKEEPQVEFEDESSDDEKSENNGNVALVKELPPGMTTARLRALAGSHVQNLSLDKEERSAKITFKTPDAAESFKKKFNNKMVAASRLVVTLH